jgi:hypothetical protein
MTKKNNWMVGEAYKPSKERREELRQTMKVWDFHDEFAWSDNKPWWLLPLQVLGAMVACTGVVLAIYYSILILFLL